MYAQYGQPQQFQPQAYGNYGAADFEAPLKPAFVQSRGKITPASMGIGVLLPWIIFTIVYWAMSFSMHYTSMGAVVALCALLGVVVLGTGVLAFQIWRRGVGDPRWFMFLFVSGALAWCIGLVAGDENFHTNMAPYFDVQNLNTYPGVDPTTFRGNQLMDAGQIQFVQGSHLDRTKSMGFKNLDTYCVAPVTKHSNESSERLPNYDFWAVGLNCCSAHAPDFHCGEYNNPLASSGLRLMKDDQRAFFRLAVQQAEAAYNINAGHPIFLYWMQDPNTEISAYQDDGYKYFLLGIGCFFAFQVFMVVIATVVITRNGL